MISEMEEYVEWLIAPGWTITEFEPGDGYVAVHAKGPSTEFVADGWWPHKSRGEVLQDIADTVGGWKR